MTTKCSDYRYRCKSCDTDITVRFLHCNNCGLVNGYFESSDPSLNHHTVCEKCNQVLKDEPLPETCNNCGVFHSEWWNLKSKKWLQPDLSIQDELGDDSFWISGDFDCEYIGQVKNSSEFHQGIDKRNYQLSISKGTLKNISRIIAPPDEITNKDRRPIRQDSVSAEVLDVENGKLVNVKLYDFRLRNYEKLGYKEVSSSGLLNGKISGKAYGYITPSNKPDPKKQVHIPLNVVPTASAEPDIKNEAPIQNTSPIKEPDVIKASDTVHDAPPRVSCSKPLIFFLSILLLIIFGWLISLACFFLMALACWLDTWLSRKMSIQGASSCVSCSLFLRFFLSIVLLIGCRWEMSLAYFISLTLACWLDNWLSKDESSIKRTIIGISLFLLSLVGIFLFAFLLEKYGCHSAIRWPLLLPLVALLLSGKTYSCLLKLSLNILWFIALICWCGTHSGDCISSASSNYSIPSITTHLDNMKQEATSLFTAKNTSNTVSQASTGNINGHHVSVDEAIKTPQLISDCKNSIYFPNASLFAFDKDKIEPIAEKDLKKLSDMLKKYPGRHVIITGHTDISGDNTPEGFLHNMDLSERRATSVINWLVQNGGLNPDLLEARGAGSKFPLTTQIGQLGINRRVEVNLNCNNETLEN